MAYATGSDLTARYDFRTLGGLIYDTNTTASTASAVQNDAIVLQALQDASGIVESAVLVAGRYTTNDLDTLPTNSAALLKRLVCDLAYTYLRQRRGRTQEEELPMITHSFETLDAIRKGERIFDIAGVIDAGVIDSPVISITTIQNQRLSSNNTHYFPTHKDIVGQ